MSESVGFGLEDETENSEPTACGFALSAAKHSSSQALPGNVRQVLVHFELEHQTAPVGKWTMRSRASSAA